MWKFLKGLFSSDTVKGVDDVLGDVAVETGRAFALAELNKALNDLNEECVKIGDPQRRAYCLACIASLRLAVTAFIATIGKEDA